MALDYLTVADVLGMHTVLIRRYGGLPGVRDPGALEAALYRPQTGYYKDTIEQAAALMESLAINHPFVDGNKRTGALLILALLMEYQIICTANSEALYQFIISISTGELRYEKIVAWLQINT